jgi:hypothetical protein
MKISTFITCIISGLVVVLLHGYASADELSLDVSKTLAVVPVKSGNVDQSVYRQFDRLVPELKKISKDKIVKLECRYSGKPDREQDVENAYKLAGRIEKYLRVRHKLDLDLWVAVDITSKAAQSSPVLTIAVFSDEIKKLDTVLIDPLKVGQQ